MQTIGKLTMLIVRELVLVIIRRGPALKRIGWVGVEESVWEIKPINAILIVQIGDLEIAPDHLCDLMQFLYRIVPSGDSLSALGVDMLLGTMLTLVLLLRSQPEE